MCVWCVVCAGGGGGDVHAEQGPVLGLADPKHSERDDRQKPIYMSSERSGCHVLVARHHETYVPGRVKPARLTRTAPTSDAARTLLT